MDLAYMCVKPQMRLYVCHQMRLCVCHQMCLLTQQSLLRSLTFARFARLFFNNLNLNSCRKNILVQTLILVQIPILVEMLILRCITTQTMDPEWTQNGPRMDPKWTQNGHGAHTQARITRKARQQAQIPPVEVRVKSCAGGSLPRHSSF